MNRRRFLSFLAGLPVVGTYAATTAVPMIPAVKALPAREVNQGGTSSSRCVFSSEDHYTVSMRSKSGVRQMTMEGDAEFCRTSVELWFKS